MYLLLLWIIRCVIVVTASTSPCKCREGITRDYTLFNGEMVSGDTNNVCLCCYSRPTNTFIKFQHNKTTVCRVFKTYSVSANSQKYECGRMNYTFYLKINDVNTEDNGDWLCRGIYNPGYRTPLTFTANPQTSRFWKDTTATTKWNPTYISQKESEISTVYNPRLPSTDQVSNVDYHIIAPGTTPGISSLTAHRSPYISTATSVICITVLAFCGALVLIITVFWSTQYLECFKSGNYTIPQVHHSENPVYQDLLFQQPLDDQDSSRNSSASSIYSDTDHYYQSIDVIRDQNKITSLKKSDRSRKRDARHSPPCSSFLIHKNTLKNDVIPETFETRSQNSVGDILKVVSDNIQKAIQTNHQTSSYRKC